MESEKKVGAHTLGPIEARLKKGTYATNPVAAARNLDLLRQVTEMPKVWKETKERATGLIHGIRAASERVEVPAAPAVASAGAGAGAAAAAAPIISSRASTLATLKPYITKLRTRHYDAHPDDINVDIAAIQPLSKELVTSKTHDLAAITEKIIGDIAAFRPSAAAPLEERRELPVSAPAVAVEERRELPLPAAVEERRELTVSAPAFASVAPEETVPVAASTGCAQLYDPCTREPLADIATLEARVRELKRAELAAAAPTQLFPLEIITRLDLLLHVVNNPGRPSIELLNYTKSGNLYEAYWDIVMCFCPPSDFPINKNFYLYKAKAESIRTIEDPQFTNRRLDYLRGRRVMSGATGVSDITFMYKHHAEVIAADECSASEPVVGAARSTLYFCSSKYYKKDASKGVDKFDIQNIVTIFKHLPEDCDRKIVLFVNNRPAVESILKNAMRTYISEEARFIYGVEDLIACLTKLYDTVRTMYPMGPITEEIIRTAFDIEEEPKPILNLRLHQHIAVDGIATAIRRFREAPAAAGLSNKFLVGILPRGGKTYIAGGLVHELQPRNIVVLLGAKSETLKQFKGELFEAFGNFQSYECVDVREASVAYDLNPAKKYIFIMSVELFKTTTSSRTLLQNIKTGTIPIDLFLCDEAHLKQATPKAFAAMKAVTEGRGASAAKSEVVREELDTVEVSDKEEENELKDVDSIIQRNVPTVYMTGTYIKPMQALSIPAEHTVLWDYQDIQKAKQLTSNESYFRESFGPLYDAALAKCIAYGESLGSIESQYRKFPELYLLTSQFTEDAKAAFAGQAEGGVPTLVQLFRVKRDFNPEEVPPNLWHTGFQNPAGIMRLLNYLCPAHGQVHEADGVAIEPISSVMTTIDHIAQSIGDRLGFFTSNFVAHSQLWFLPHMQGHPLKKRMCALAGAIFQLPWFRKHFDVVAVSSSIDWRSIRGSDDKHIEISGPSASGGAGRFSWKCPDPANEDGLKGCLVDLEASARSRKKGLIILAQNMLHLGISLKCVDIVVLLDDGNKVDERIQKMYRALTESTNKKGGFIVDMNYFRTVTALMNYAIAMVEARTKRTVHQEQLGNIFKDVLNVYSFDIDKPDLKVAIDKTLPELQRLLGESRRSGGDSLVVGTAAAALNRNVETGLAADYSADYDLFLGAIRDSIEKHRLLRSEGAGVREATSASAAAGAGTGPPEEESESEEPTFTEILKADATPAQKRAAYADIFKTTMKLGIFGTNAPDLTHLIDTLGTNEEVREILYDTLIKRGSVIEDTVHRESQKNYLINKLIVPGLEKLVAVKKNASYRDMKEAVEDERKYPAEIQSVLEYIRDHLAPKDAERHKFGEVFTPMTLVHEMLDTLNETGVWNDPALTWLDPANGMGNFPIATFMRLCYGFRVKDGRYVGIGREGEGVYNPGLTEIIPAEAERRRHIVQRMLFMVELNTKNIAISKKLFKKLAPGVESNIIQMHRTLGFLAEGPMEFPNGTVNEFDIVMGNPPYNSGSVKSVTTRETVKRKEGMNLDKPKNLWIPFVKKSIEKHIKKNGYLLFIHPIGWFKPDEKTKTHDLILENQIITMKIYKNDSGAKDLFSGKGKISIAYYLLEKTIPVKKTHIISIDNSKEDALLSTNSLLCLKNNSIISKIQSSGVALFGDSPDYLTHSISQKLCESGEYKQIHRISDKGEITFVKTNNLHKYQTNRKIILNGYKYPRYFYDKKGEYGVIGSHQHFFIGNDLDKLEAYFKTKLSALLLSSLKYDMDYIEPKYYPDIRALPLETITDDSLADFFGFTAKERASIAATEYPMREYKLTEITCAQLNKEEPKAGGFRRTRKNRRS